MRLIIHPDIAASNLDLLNHILSTVQFVPLPKDIDLRCNFITIVFLSETGRDSSQIYAFKVKQFRAVNTFS